jgi:mRNA interferase RelE/StbE
LAWTIELTEAAVRQLAQLDKSAERRIWKFLRERLALMANPRSIGQALHGQLGDFWKYRVGDYRLIANIEDDRLLILVIRIGHRREVYRLRTAKAAIDGSGNQVRDRWLAGHHRR